MKLIFLKSIVLTFVFLIATPLVSQPKLLEADVRTSVEKFGGAFLKADVSILKNLLCENYIHVNGSSGNVINKIDWLKFVESRRLLLDSGELVINSYKIQDLKVNLFGNAAIVTGIVESTGSRNGIPFISNIRFTNVWIIEDGNLRRASFHDSAIPES